jgi:hypothetical protein
MSSSSNRESAYKRHRESLSTSVVDQYLRHYASHGLAQEVEIVHDYLYAESDDDESDDDDEEEDRPRKTRRRKGVVFYRDDNEELQVLPPTMSLWYNLYCRGEEIGEELQPSFLQKFRLRFRLPYSDFLELVGYLEEEAGLDGGFFRRWRPGAKAVDGKPSAPINLLLLTTLRYLGRGWTFDDLEECTAISRDVIRTFFHQFIEYGSTKLFAKWVHPPQTMEEATAIEHEYSMAGFPGCIGSMDATHIENCRVSYRNRQAHLSFKLPFTARTYNIVTNHRRRILSTTEGHPARWNDKSLIRFDKLATVLHEGSSLLDNLEFELYDYGEDNEVVKVKYRGAWLLVDNGYLNWGVTIPPMKETISRSEWRFSKWLESMRKDVECTFGIMKGRWRVLKAGIRVHGTIRADQIWKTCCALHNMLLESDGLNEQWTSEWEGGLGDIATEEIPESVRTLLSSGSSTIDFSRYDMSGMGYGDDVLMDDEEEDLHVGVEEHDISGAVKVHKMSMVQFRKKLVRHFEIAFTKKEISWPRARLNNVEEPCI